MSVVTVACKLPNGIHLDYKGKRVTLKGSNDFDAVGGFGITENVDESFFTGWLSEHAEKEMVKNGLIFAHGKKNDAVAQANADAGKPTGLDEIDPESMPGNLQPTEETKAKINKGRDKRTLRTKPV